MNQEERRRFLIEELLGEQPFCCNQEIPADEGRQKRLIRALMNVRCPGAISRRFLEVQDAYLQGKLSQKHCDLLESCYYSCLKLAEENNVDSIAFCCISTGVFMFPNDKAAKIAVRTVQEYKEETGSKSEVVFNVFKEQDERIYSKLLRAD